MNPCLFFAGLALTSFAVGAVAAAPPSVVPKAATEACEAAVADTVRRMRGREAQEVQFVGVPHTLSPTPDDEIGLKGEGRYRTPGGGSIPFTYSCAFNPKTSATNGVVFKETAGARTATAASADKAWQPDLANLSPEACEAATAAALKTKYPRVDRIAFGSDSRQLRPAPNEHTTLEGQGGLVRAPGMNAIAFTYRCEIDTRSGKVVSVQTSD